MGPQPTKQSAERREPVAVSSAPTSIKRLRVKIFLPGNSKFARRTFAARPGCVLTEDGIDQILDFLAEEVEKLFADHEYQVVQVAPDQFNFVWRSEKAPARAEKVV